MRAFFYADANALYFVASTNGSLRGLDTTAGLYRLGHGHATPRLLDQDAFLLRPAWLAMTDGPYCLIGDNRVTPGGNMENHPAWRDAVTAVRWDRAKERSQHRQTVGSPSI